MPSLEPCLLKPKFPLGRAIVDVVVEESRDPIVPGTCPKSRPRPILPGPIETMTDRPNRDHDPCGTRALSRSQISLTRRFFFLLGSFLTIPCRQTQFVDSAGIYDQIGHLARGPSSTSSVPAFPRLAIHAVVAL